MRFGHWTFQRHDPTNEAEFSGIVGYEVAGQLVRQGQKLLANRILGISQKNEVYVDHRTLCDFSKS